MFKNKRQNMFNFLNKEKKEMSKLKKKLMIYFLLISIVSISVSAEIILEMSSIRFKNQIKNNFYSQLQNKISKDEYESVKNSVSTDDIFTPISDLRNRMILLLLVVSGCIIGSFYLFAKDIVTPMDKMVEATKKIADGDLTVSVPIMSTDEIGQVATLINSMNVNMQDMIIQIRQEVQRYSKKINYVKEKITGISDLDNFKNILENKRISQTQLKQMIHLVHETENTLQTMTGDLSSLRTFVDMYKTYTPLTEVDQNEIEEAIKQFSEISKGIGAKI
jgi:methyl-accepting chemotaxis protein